MTVCQGAGEGDDIADGEVEALGAGRRDDVGGVPGEEEPSVAHRLVDVTPHRGDGLGRDGAALQLPAVGGLQAAVEFVPDLLVAPVVGVRALGDLEVGAGDGRRAHGQEGEAAVVAGIDQLVVGRGHIGEDAEPAEGVRALEDPGDVGGYGLAAHAPRAVAGDDVVAVEDVLAALVAEADARALGLGALDGQRLRLEEQRLPRRPGGR